MTEQGNTQTPMLEDQLARLIEQKSKVLSELTALGENIKNLNNVHEQLKGAIAFAQSLLTPEDVEKEEED